jgi:hypothetical protein
MPEPGEHVVTRDLSIVLSTSQRYDMPYKYFDELMDYFTDPTVKQFQFETTDHVWVYLHKNAIAAIETSHKADHKKVHGFAAIGSKDAVAPVSGVTATGELGSVSAVGESG